MHRKKGSSFVELATGLIVLIPIALAIFDFCIIVMGVQVNDSTCREAARVAASGNPLDAQSRAQAIIDRANSHASSTASSFSLVSVLSTVTPQDVQALGTFGGLLKGSVTVQTDVSIRPMIVQFVFSGGAPLHFRSEQTFPFTYVVPNTTPTTFLDTSRLAS
jgi:Flp pilus assembly protein TadG